MTNKIFILLFILLISCKQKLIYHIEEAPWGKVTFVIPTFKDKKFNIKDFGAKSDSGYNNQLAIQQAIDKCSASGGGNVIIPDGKWMTSFLELKSNVNLYLEYGSILFFSDSIELYTQPTFTRWEGIECMNYHPLIYAKDAENIAITGNGVIDGNGRKWWRFAWKKQELTLSVLYQQAFSGLPPEKRNCLEYGEASYLRPSLIQFIDCRNIYLRDYEVQSGPMWTNHFVYCNNVVVKNIKVITNGPNNDGFVPDASTNVLIDSCYFSTGDDCIVIKSGLNEDGWRVGKMSENIIIKNCNTRKGNGGIVIGSEMSGGVRNIYGHDCNFIRTKRGLRIKSMIGRGGIVENIWFENIRMDSIKMNPIIVTMNYGTSSIAPKGDSMPIFKNIYFKNIFSTNSKSTINIEGVIGQKIDSISFENCKLSGDTGIRISNAQNITFKGISIKNSFNEPIEIYNSQQIIFKDIEAIASSDTFLKIHGTNHRIVFEQSNVSSYKARFNCTDSDLSEVTFNQK